MRLIRAELKRVKTCFRPQYQGGYGGYPAGGYPPGGYPAGGNPAGGNQTVIIQDRGGGGGGSGMGNFGTGLLLGSALGFGLGKLVFNLCCVYKEIDNIRCLF